MRLHIGCGKVLLEGYINTDIKASSGVAELDMRDLGSRFEPESLTEILAIQCVVYLYPWEAEQFFKDSYKVLLSGGKLIMEMISVYQCALWITEHEAEMGEVARINLYGCGLDHLESHTKYQPILSGWTPRSINKALRNVGFQVEIKRALTHWPERDMRVEATKP